MSCSKLTVNVFPRWAFENRTGCVSIFYSYQQEIYPTLLHTTNILSYYTEILVLPQASFTSLWAPTGQELWYDDWLRGPAARQWDWWLGGGDLQCIHLKPPRRNGCHTLEPLLAAPILRGGFSWIYCSKTVDRQTNYMICFAASKPEPNPRLCWALMWDTGSLAGRAAEFCVCNKLFSTLSQNN